MCIRDSFGRVAKRTQAQVAPFLPIGGCDLATTNHHVTLSNRARSPLVTEVAKGPDRLKPETSFLKQPWCQAPRSPAKDDANVSLAERRDPLSVGSVSYTHLDVYKRQVTKRSRSNDDLRSETPVTNRL